MNSFKEINKLLEKEGVNFLDWSSDNPIGNIPRGVSKEGAGENRIPLTHLANSLPVYLYFSLLLKKSKSKKAAVLDLGCGTGRNISYINSSIKKFDFYGIDYSSACIEYAFDQYAKLGVNFARYKGKIIPYPDSTFDYIVSSHVIEHINKKEAGPFIKEILRVLKPNGAAVIGTPNRKYCQDLYYKNPKELKKYRLIIPHKHEFYKEEMIRLVEKNKKLVKSYKLLQTTNPLNRELMEKSIKNIKPTNSTVGKIKYGVYNSIRSYPPAQDLMARLGTEFIMRGQDISYKKIIRSTKIVDTNKDIGDNFILQINKQ